MPSYFETTALVLRSANYRDYDRMVTLLTEEQGRVDAAARGCRKPKSELLNAAEPFVCGQYQFYTTGERCTLTQCRITDSFYPLRQDYDRLCVGAGWLKLLETIAMPDQPIPGLTGMAVTALTYLTYSALPKELCDCMFLLKYSFFGGFAPRADRCAVCGAPAGQVALGFSARKGGCVCRKCASDAVPLSEGARRILLKAPRTPYRAVEKLDGHPNLDEAYQRIRELVRANME